jgi:predicted phage tail protein
VQYKDGLSYFLPLTHGIYEGTYTMAVQAVYAMDASINDGVITFKESATDFQIVIDVTVTYQTVTYTVPVTVFVYAYEDPMPSFNSGSLGMLPTFVGDQF